MLPPPISTPLQTLKREVPEISEVTENPEVPLVRTMIVYVLIISLFVIVSRPYCSIIYCLVSHNRGYRSTCTIVLSLTVPTLIALSSYCTRLLYCPRLAWYI